MALPVSATSRTADELVVVGDFGGDERCGEKERGGEKVKWMVELINWP